MKRVLVLASMFSAVAVAQDLKVDLRSYDGGVKDFGKKDEKSFSYALASVIEVLMHQNGHPGFAIDAESMFKDHGKDDLEKQIKKFEYKDLALSVEVKKFTELKKWQDIPAQLDAGTPVLLSFKTTPKGLIKCTEPVVSGTKTSSDNFAVVVMGYAGDMLLVKNAQGLECGEAGYQHFPLSMCGTIKKINCAAYTIDKLKIKVEVTPTPVPTEVPIITPMQEIK